MRRPFLLTLVLLTLLLLAAAAVFTLQRQALPSAVATTAPASTAGIPRISIEELRGQLATSSPPLVWDIRPTSSYAEGHVPGSRVLTLDAIPDAAANLDRQLSIVTICA